MTRGERLDTTTKTEAEDQPHAPGASRLLAAPSRLAGGLLVAGVVFDVTGRAAHQPWLWITGAHLLTAGLAAALIAVLVGLIPALRSRQPRSRRPPRWTTAVIVAAVGLIALARWVRGHHEIPPDPPIVGAELVAAAMIVGAFSRRARSP